MAKTGAKRKADAVTFEEKDDASAAAGADGNVGADGANGDGGAAPDDTSPKTPDVKLAARDDSTGSSAGMKMRSGRKKKRHKPNSAEQDSSAFGGSAAVGTTPRRSRRSAAADLGGAVAVEKQNGESKNHENDDDDGEVQVVTADDEGRKMPSETPQESAADDVEATAENEGRKAPPEKTQGAAVAHAAGSTAGILAGEGEDEGGTNNHAPSNGGGNSLVTLASQNLRLPSQHTPKPVEVVAAQTATPAAPPPGGMRLLFESAKKPSAAAVGARNTLLMQTRQQQQPTSAVTEVTPAEESQQSMQQNKGEVVVETANAPAESKSPFAWLEEENAVLYAQAWFLFLLIFFAFGNLASVMSVDGSLASQGAWSAWNVRVQGERLARRYGVVRPTPPPVVNVTIAVVEIEIDDEEDEDAPAEEDIPEEPEIIIEIMTVTDPTLLSNARAALRARRMNLYDVKKLESGMEEIRVATSILDDATEGWRRVHPELFDSNGTGAAGGDGSIREMVMKEIASNDVVIFSKSYCPHCKATKELFNHVMDSAVESYVKVLELDMIEIGEEVQSILLEVTGQKTVPNVFVRGWHAGGNDDVQAAYRSGELKDMLQSDMSEIPSSDPRGMKTSFDAIDGARSSIAQTQESMWEWEEALVGAEEMLESLGQGEVSPGEANEAVGELSEASMVPGMSAMVLDVSKISVPGEGCQGMDYIPLEPKEQEEEQEEEEEEEKEEEEIEDLPEEEEMVEVVGGIDVTALDFASDAPVRLEDAQSAYESLLMMAQATSERLVGDSGPSPNAQRWARQIVQEELRNKGVRESHPSIDTLHPPVVDPDEVAAMSSSSSSDRLPSYTARDAIRDIDRMLEAEDADRTGKFDHASLVHGAGVVRRGPYATSYSLYETLPLINRILANLKLRFYGHPPEAALLPTFPMHARGQCWSFPSEFLSSRSRGSPNDDGLRGDYATLTVSLTSAIAIAEIVIEHVSPNLSSDPSTAIKQFRVVGFEDGGAYGEPWELGSFKFLVGPTMQAFSIPTTLDGQAVPKLQSVAIAVDSNWGSENYACLYRVRVHGA